MSSGSKKIAGLTGRVFLVLLWALPLLLALQVAGAWRMKDMKSYLLVASRAKDAYEHDWVKRTRAADSLSKPPRRLLPGPRPPREDARDATPEERAQLAQDRNELILVCDAEGHVKEKYLPSREPELARLGEAFMPGMPMWQGFAPYVAGDIEATVKRSAQGGHGLFQAREYPFTFPDGSEDCFDVAFLSTNTFEPIDEVPVFVQLSMWRVLWESFRPDYYLERNNDLFTDMSFWTNRRGWRSPEVAVPKPEGIYRIVCIGGSTTVEGPNNDMTYPRMLEANLREALSTDKIEVVNCGIYGYDSVRELAKFDDYLALEPDLILHYNFINDFNGALETFRQRARDERTAAVVDFTNWFYPLQHFANGLLMPSDAGLRDIIGERVFANHEKMLAKARAAGVEMAYATYAHHDMARLPLAEQNYYAQHSVQLSNWNLSLATQNHVIDIYNTMLREFTEREHAYFLDVAGSVTGGLDVFTDAVGHMHLEGIERKAESLAAMLESVVKRRLEQPVETNASSPPAVAEPRN
ncbi:MAG: hypothetical protein GC168_12755 [Candidatus Hydrogenedens sp.]|nr:hypothetical protein [Candidatus Hydrogenedens sp.]